MTTEILGNWKLDGKWWADDFEREFVRVDLEGTVLDFMRHTPESEWIVARVWSSGSGQAQPQERGV